MPDEVQQQFEPAVHTSCGTNGISTRFYNVLFVQPVLFISRRIADFDRKVIDRFIDGCAMAVRGVSTIDDTIDRLFVDGS